MMEARVLGIFFAAWLGVTAICYSFRLPLLTSLAFLARPEVADPPLHQHQLAKPEE